MRPLGGRRAAHHFARGATLGTLLGIALTVAGACASPLVTAQRTAGAVAQLDAAAWSGLTGYERAAERQITDKALAGGSIADARAQLDAQQKKIKPAEEALIALDGALASVGEALARGEIPSFVDLLAAEARVVDELGKIGVKVTPQKGGR